MDAQTPNATERKWWTSKRDTHAAVFSLTGFLRKHQKERRRMNRLHMRIVSNDDPAGRGLYGTPMEAAKSRLDGGSEKSRYMLCLSIVDTAASIVSSSKPTLQALTQAGDWSMQRRAKERTLALSGQMRHLRIDELGPKIFRDAAICDVAGVFGYLHPETRRVCLDRVLSNEILVDHNEAIHGKPRNLYRVYPVNRERLKELYPRFADKIENASGVDIDDRDDFFLTRESAADSVLVAESWHLGPAIRPVKGKELPASKLGRHVLCVSNATLVDEPYKHQEFPFAFLKYADFPVGWYGQSLVARTKESQRRINKLIKKYEISQDLNSKCVTVVPRSSGLGPDQITNLPGQVVFSESGEPKLLRWDGTLPDLRADIPAIREECLNNEGLSEQQVQGDRIQGVNSAVGIRAADDVQSRRHVHPQRRYERWHLDVAELIARLNDDATEEDPSYSVTSQVRRGRRDFINSVKWADVQVDPDDVRLQIFPTSSLSTTPKGRRDDVMGLLQAGMITQQVALELLDMPDLDTETSNALAEVDYSRWQVEEVMDGNGFEIDPILTADGLSLCLDTARKAYLQCLYSKAPDDVLENLRDYMKSLSDEIARIAPKPAPVPEVPMDPAMAMPPEMMPPGEPPLPPVPNVPLMPGVN